MTASSKKASGRSSTGAARADDGAESRKRPRKKSAPSSRRATSEPVGISGVPGSKNDSRRCSATANRTGERCRAPAIKGGTVCRVHGGSLPGVKKAAKERLLELVDPALAALQKILTDPRTDDHNKVRAAQIVLDRTGFKPGMEVHLTATPFDVMIAEVAQSGVVLDRALPDHPTSAKGALQQPTLADGGGEHSWEDYEQAAEDARAEAWREYDDEDAQPYVTKLDPYDGNTVKGEVVSILPDRTKDPITPGEYTGGPPTQSRYDVPPDRPPTDPPRYGER